MGAVPLTLHAEIIVQRFQIVDVHRRARRSVRQSEIVRYVGRPVAEQAARLILQQATTHGDISVYRSLEYCIRFEFLFITI